VKNKTGRVIPRPVLFFCTEVVFPNFGGTQAEACATELDRFQNG
jgi:hypothetical protein